MGHWLDVKPGHYIQDPAPELLFKVGLQQSPSELPRARHAGIKGFGVDSLPGQSWTAIRAWGKEHCGIENNYHLLEFIKILTTPWKDIFFIITQNVIICNTMEITTVSQLLSKWMMNIIILFPNLCTEICIKQQFTLKGPSRYYWIHISR